MNTESNITISIPLLDAIIDEAEGIELTGSVTKEQLELRTEAVKMLAAHYEWKKAALQETEEI